eukprot:5172238-Pleurochrysis_carterae.AAC.2
MSVPVLHMCGPESARLSVSSAASRTPTAQPVRDRCGRAVAPGPDLTRVTQRWRPASRRWLASPTRPVTGVAARTPPGSAV